MWLNFNRIFATVRERSCFRECTCATAGRTCRAHAAPRTRCRATSSGFVGKDKLLWAGVVEGAKVGHRNRL